MKTNPAWESCVPCTNLSPANPQKDFPKSTSCQAAWVSFKPDLRWGGRDPDPGPAITQPFPCFSQEKASF